MRIMTFNPRRLLAASAALVSLGLAGPAVAQYAPYAAAPAQYPPAQSPYAAGAGQYGAYAQQQAIQPQYINQGAYQGYAAARPAQPGYQVPGYQVPGYQPGYQTPGYSQTPAATAPYAVPHVAMNYQAAPTTPTSAPATGGSVAPADTLPLTPPAENVAPGAAQNGGAYAPQPTPAADNSGYGYGQGGYGQGGYGQGGGYESYPGAGCPTGNCNPGNAGGYAGGYGGACAAPAPYGACDNYSTYGGMGGVLSKHAGCGNWFGGVYGLLMDRDNANKYPLVFSSVDAAPVGYYPPSSDIVLRTRDADIGFQGGVEFRLGRTFGCGGGGYGGNACDPCSGYGGGYGGCGGCGGCGSCGPRWGLEGVYWTLFDDDAADIYVDQATLRTYSMMPMAGLEYDAGTGYRPVNEYWDYGPPVRVQDLRVTLARVSSSFEVQNVEVNLLRLNVCGGGGPATYSCATGPSTCGAGGGYGCDSGCAPAAACGPTGPRYSCTGVCGFRWMQFDEDFMYGVDFFNTTTSATGFLNYWSTVENNLFGAQVGCNGMYRVGCKWGLHVNTLVGLFGNDVDVRQYMVSPTGNVRFIGSQENFDVRAYKTDVTMLGELRLGASYQATCHCRLYGGWRAIGVSGIALATDQAPSQFLDVNQLRNYVNSNGSLILHGLQAGVEWNY